MLSSQQSRFATPRYFEKYTLVCQPNYMVGAPCICMAEPEAFQDELSSGNTYPIRNTCGPPHGRGWLGSGSSRPTACTPGLHTQHAAPGISRGGLCRRGCPTKPYFSRRPRGGPHIFYMADELILERFGLRHTNTWGTHHVIWLTNICIFFKIARGGKSTLV